MVSRYTYLSTQPASEQCSWFELENHSNIYFDGGLIGRHEFGGEDESQDDHEESELNSEDDSSGNSGDNSNPEETDTSSETGDDSNSEALEEDMMLP